MFCFNWPDWIQALAALLEALAAVGLVVLTKKLYAMLPARLKHTGAMANHDRWSRTSFRAEPPDFRRFQRRARRTRISEVRVQWQTIGRLGKKSVASDSAMSARVRQMELLGGKKSVSVKHAARLREMQLYGDAVH